MLNILHKPLTKKQKSRTVNFVCSKKTSVDFDFYGFRLLEDKQKKEILDGLRLVCEYNKIAFKSNKVSDYWKELAKHDFLLPVNK